MCPNSKFWAFMLALTTVSAQSSDHVKSRELLGVSFEQVNAPGFQFPRDPFRERFRGFDFPRSPAPRAVTANLEPVPRSGLPWDIIMSADVKESVDQIWESLNSPREALFAAFRHYAFEIVPMGSFYRTVFGSGEDMILSPDEISEVGRFHRFVVFGHSLGIFNVRPNFVDIAGTEIFIRIEEIGPSRSRVHLGLWASITPEETRAQILLLLNGWLEDLVEHFQYRYGAAGCKSIRAPTGVCNNPNPMQGSAHTPLRRQPPLDPDFSNGVDAPSGNARISPRFISNIVFHQDSETDGQPNKLRLSDIFVFFGQFLDHDVGISPVGAFATEQQPLFSLNQALFNEELPIDVPEDDPVFHGPNAKISLAFERAIVARDRNSPVVPRSIVNALTSYLDLGQVYGSDNVRYRVLRTFSKGLLRTSRGDFLPFNGNVEDGVGVAIENAPNAESHFYVAGDIRAQENPALAALHVVWMREHNNIARELDVAFGFELDDDTLFNTAKSICTALYQSVVFSEWLPLLLGPGVVDPNGYSYDPNLDPSVDAFFTTVSFRFGHSMVGTELWKVAPGEVTPFSVLPLRDSFFNQRAITPETIDDITRGMIWHFAQEMDEQVVEDLRSFLFGEGAPGMDLVALNIQRGRDLGIPSYNGARQMFGLPAARNFEDVTSNPIKERKLRRAYKSVDYVDPFAGGLSEDRPEGRLFGDLFQKSLEDQFRRLRDGDRMFYKDFPFPDELVDAYPRLRNIIDDKVKMMDVIARNTDINYTDLRDRRSVFQI